MRHKDTDRHRSIGLTPNLTLPGEDIPALSTQRQTNVIVTYGWSEKPWRIIRMQAPWCNLCGALSSTANLFGFSSIVQCCHTVRDQKKSKK